ncbi:MAG: hypothetical protein ABFR31_05875, partial [Thermodesulfobacteriota bacterium]
MKEEVAIIAGRRVILMDSISYISFDERDDIIVSGSHGGTAAASYAIQDPAHLVIFNDAGVGKDQAGIVSLDLLQNEGIAAATVYHTSACIGVARDTWKNGIISYVNPLAKALGICIDDSVQTAIQKLDQ